MLSEQRVVSPACRVPCRHSVDSCRAWFWTILIFHIAFISRVCVHVCSRIRLIGPSPSLRRLRKSSRGPYCTGLGFLLRVSPRFNQFLLFIFILLVRLDPQSSRHLCPQLDTMPLLDLLSEAGVDHALLLQHVDATELFRGYLDAVHGSASARDVLDLQLCWGELGRQLVPDGRLEVVEVVGLLGHVGCRGRRGRGSGGGIG